MNLRCSRRASCWSKVGLWMVVVVGPVGCGGPFTGEVSGTVKYNGNLLPGGIVTISHPDGRVATCTIREDGSYSIPNAPGGEVKVSVQTLTPLPAIPPFMLRGAPKSESVERAGKYVKIPERYSDPAKSGLNLTVKRGSQEFPIELTD